MSRMHTEDLHIHYGNNKVINGIDIKIPDKQVTAIIGSNGCGKSTLLNAMTRIIPYKDGTVIYVGIEISSEQNKQHVKKHDILAQSQESTTTLKDRDLSTTS